VSFGAVVCTRLTMASTVVIYATYALLFAFFSSSLAADNDTTTSTRKPRPIDKGLEPLYVMTDTFLDVVHPESRGHALNDPRFNSGNVAQFPFHSFVFEVFVSLSVLASGKMRTVNFWIVQWIKKF